MRLTTIGIALAAALLPGVASGQQWRTIESARQLTSTDELQVTLTFAGGKFELNPLPGKLLYQMQLHYDEQATDAMHEYEAADHQLKLGMRNANMGFRALKAMKHDEGSSMTVGLNPTVPMKLELNLGGSEAEAELGGMSLKSLRIHMGLAGGKVAFSSANLVEMDEMSIDIGLGGAAIENLGNANVAQIHVSGGMGGVQLEFGDKVMRDVRINADVAMSGLKIQVPESAGVSIQAATKMASFKPQGLEKVDGAWVSPNWKQAATHVTIVANTALGSLEVNHAAP
ncbi:MAG: hypothetical protein ACJ79K_06500 [Gemmatimonadaceae bacterium]